ncbi:MAG: RNA 2',3'-cyclic phosphodiesterase [Thiobacillus sp.]|nr:RNA 2',3'-cyclic phosphodiesterase [Thiobacillus sp.]
MKQDAALGPETARVFFALWPDEGVHKALVRAAGILHARHGGRQTRPDSTHLTLVFVGQVDEARIPDLLAMARGIQIGRFDTDFDKAECWRHNHIGCLVASETPEHLGALVKALETGLQGLGVPFDKRTYKPHITLLRKADCRQETGAASGDGKPEKENPAPEAIRWPARDFVLVKSSLRPDGALYEELGRWPLL